MDLPEDLVRRIKIRAVQEGRPLKRLVAELLNQSLNAPSAPVSIPVTSQVSVAANGFPIFRCGSNASASRMTVEALIELEQEAQSAEEWQRAGIPL